MVEFVKRKIKLEPTLGEKLKAVREERKITLLQAEGGSKVRVKHLAAIENSNWHLLPGEVYARGFVLTYSKFLEFDCIEALALYNKEAVSLNKKRDINLRYNKSFKVPRFLVTPKLLAYSMLSVFAFSMVAYIISQVAGFAGSPNLKITNPENNIVLDSDSVELSGITDTDTFVKVNSEGVPVTGDGHFSLNLKLHSGINVVKVQAVNKAQKESSEIYTVEYRPKTAAAKESLTENNF